MFDYWTYPDREERLRELVRFGDNPNRIATVLSVEYGPISRDAVVYQIGQLGLEAATGKTERNVPVSLPKTNFKPVRLSIGAQHPHMPIVWEAWARKYGVMNYGA